MKSACLELDDEPPIEPTPAAAGPVSFRRGGVLKADLRASMGDGAGFGMMVGMGETYLAAFVLAVGLSEVTAGLVASLPLLAGGLMQMVSPRAVRGLGSHRRWVVLCALVQAASFLPLVAAALLGAITAPTALAVAAVYWGAGMATGPAWNTWIGTLVPRPIRPRYFARRTRISQAAVLAGFLIGGAVLQAGAECGAPLAAFAVLFAAAAAFRAVSAGFLARQSEPVPVPPNMRREPPLALLRRLYCGPGGRLLRYILLLQVAVQISGPYFSPYMLRKLHLSYADFVVLIAASFVARILALPVLGQLAHRCGARRLLWLGGAGIVPVAGLWLVSDSFAWLLAVQCIAGIAWGAYELAVFLLFFDSIPEEERTGVLTVFNLANAAALVCGSLLGGFVLHGLGATHGGYAALFALSTAGRLLTLVFLRQVPDAFVETAVVSMRTLAVRPADGSLDRPIVPALPAQSPEAAPWLADEAEPAPPDVPESLAAPEVVPAEAA